MTKGDPIPIILHDFMIGVLALPVQLLVNRPSLKLQFSIGDANVYTCMNVSTDSDDGIWIVKGSIKISSASGDLKVFISIEDDGLVSELCNTTVACLDLAMHAQEHSKDPYEILLDDATSSRILVVTCMTRISTSRDGAISDLSTPVLDLPVGDGNSVSSIQNTSLSYQGNSSSADPIPNIHISPKYIELERQYKKARSMPLELRAHAFNTIGYRYFSILEELSDTVMMDRAISILDEAVQCSSIFDDRRAEYLTDLSSALLTRFQRTNDLTALQTAIVTSEDAVRITDSRDPYKSQTLNIHALAVKTRYDQLGDMEDLQLAITLYEKAIKSVSDPKKTLHALNNLTNALMRRFERLANLQDLEAAVLHLQKIVELTPDGHPDKPGYFGNLGVAFETRLNRLGRLEDLEEAIRCKQLAVELTPDDHPDKPMYLSNLGITFQIRFDRLGDHKDLETAIRQKQLAVELTPNGHPDKPSRLSNLGTAFEARFDHLSDLEDLEKAIYHKQLALELTPDGHPDKPRRLSNLAVAFETRFDRLGDLKYLETAIRHKQFAVKLTPDGHPDKPSYLGNLGTAFKRRFDRLSELEDLEKAIRHQQLAVELTPNSHSNKPIYLNNLGSALEKRFDRLGHLEDLETAIHHDNLAVELTPDGHSNKPIYLSCLGCAYETRFNRLGNLKDLEISIRYIQLAVELTPDGHPDKPGYLSNLGNSLEKRFHRLGHFEDLQTAIRHEQLAVELAPDDNPHKSIYLNNLANSLDNQFSLLKDAEVIEASVLYRLTAIKLTPEGHTERPSRFMGLATTLVRQFQLHGDIRYLEKAITSCQKALDLVPDGHPQKCKMLANLGNTLYLRYEKTGKLDDLRHAYECSSSVANLLSAPPADRLREARQWARRSIELGASSLPAYQVAIDMLPRIAWLGLPIHGQHALLEQVGEVVHDAIGAAIEAEEYKTAVEWAEAGRSITWQNFLNLRSPLDELRSAHPSLAAQLQSISQQLEMVGYGHSSQEGQVDLKGMGMVSQSPTQLALNWDKTVEEIRAKPKFESFLKTKSFAQLARVTCDGPVVILNVQKERCAALLIIPEEGGSAHIASVPLPDFSLLESRILYMVLQKVLTIGHVRDRNHLAREDRKIHQLKNEQVDGINLERILALLWVKVVKPVVEALAYQPQTNDLPRIWWCATGSLAFLPIHAAGIYDEEHEEPGHKLSDYVVSSYTPTLSALLHNSISSPERVSLLAVAQAEAPGASRIPNTEVEVERIRRIATNVPFTSLMKGEAMVERVLEEMGKNSWVHLACHGTQDAEQPMKSGLLLHNGRLELERLISKPLPNADFAFLSACQTATGDESVAEESVHLAAGMIFSGYKGVIATMWSINDSIAPQIAEDVYRYMLGNGKPDRKKSAHALHYAVRRLRESKVDVLTWVPFIHIGR